MMNSRIAALTLASLFVHAGCASTPKVTQKDPKRVGKPAPRPVPPPPPPPAPVRPQEDLAVWLGRMQSSENAFTIKDRQLVAAMTPAPKPGSIGEAALVVGILRDILTPPGGNEKFQEVDLPIADQSTTDKNGVLPKQTRAIDPTTLLEQRTREKGVDVIGALAINPLLKNVTVFTWAWNATAMDGNSDIFKQNMATVIKSEAMLWHELAQKTGAIGVTPTPTAVLPPPVAATQTPPTAVVTIPSPTPVAAPAGPDLDSEKLMVSAQDAAAKENYAKAVEDAGKIPSTAPNYSIAQESVRMWSNRAVTDLRKKAAYEYRSASSVTDTGVKRTYLNKAKAYLEEAAQKFPAASNLDTVKENLGMITSELDRL